MVHDLKVHPPYFERLFTDEKTFEVRKNDRDYQVGDLLNLREWSPEKGEYTMRMVSRRVTYILHGGQFGIEEGYCVLGIKL
jgi:ribosomal protein S17